MSLLSIIHESKSAELGSLLLDIKENIVSYDEAKSNAQHQRMLIIGKVVEWKNQYPQRSTDRAALDKAMSEEGWGQMTISENYTAFKEYNRLHSLEVPEYKELAENASVSHLLEFSRATDKTVLYDAYKTLKQTGKMPSVKKVQAHKLGYTNNKFESRGGGRGYESSNSLPQTPSTSTYTPQVEPERVLIDVTPEPSIPEVAAVVEGESLQKLDPTERTVMRLIETLQELSLDDVYVRPDLLNQIKPYHQQLEALTSLIESSRATNFR